MGTKLLVHTNHTTLRYLMANKEAKPRMIRLVSFLLEFDIEVKDRNGCENQVGDHTLRLEVDT